MMCSVCVCVCVAVVGVFLEFPLNPLHFAYFSAEHTGKHIPFPPWNH